MTISARTRSAAFSAMALAALLAIGGNASAQEKTNPFSSLLNTIQQAASAVSAGQKAGQQVAPQQQQQQQQQGVQAAVAGQSPQQPLVLKADLRALYAKGTVSGADLYDTLKAIRQEARAQRTAQAWAAFSISMDSTLNSIQAGNFNISQTLQKTALDFMLQMIKSQASEVGMKALDEHLKTLLDDKDALAKESITLPTGIQSEAQAKRVINMATLVIAARISAKILERAEGDFKSLEKDYGKLLSQREQATALLYTVILQRKTAQQQSDGASKDAAEAMLKQGLTTDDIAFIDNDIGRLSIGDFQKDMAAQNLAISYLRAKDPSAYQNYKTQADDYVARSNAYLRTVSGVAAFGGVLVSFAQTIGEMATDKQGGAGQQVGNALQAMPLGIEFINAAFPAAKLAAGTAIEGVVLQPAAGLLASMGLSNADAFVLTDQESSKKVRKASDVYQMLNQRQSETLLQDALFRERATGFLAQVSRCDPAEAGRMMDAAVSKDQRSSFAKEYFSDPKLAEDYSFLNALESPGTTSAERQLGDTLLGSDHRAQSSVSDKKRRDALAAVQKQVAQDYRKWGDEQLTRLIFANREGAQIQYATLQLGSVSVRPVPSMQSLYVYESQANACKRTVLGEPEAPSKTKKTAKAG